MQPTNTAFKKFGTFSGVFTPTLLTILGVIMYLRMGWVVGNAGLLGAWLIIGISFFISTLKIEERRKKFFKPSHHSGAAWQTDF